METWAWTLLVIGLGVGTCKADNTGNTLHVISPPPSSLAFLAATSSGNQSGEVTLSVTYRAPSEHTTVWHFNYFLNTPSQRYASIETAGTRRYINGNTYSSSLTVPSNAMSGSFYVELYGGNDNAMVRLNTNFAFAKTEMTIPEVKLPVSNISFNLVTPDDEDLNVTFIVDEGFEMFYIIYTGLDMTRDRAELISIGASLWSKVFTVTKHPRVNGMTTTVVTVKQPYAAQGGFLTIECAEDKGIYWEVFVPSITTGYVVTIPPAGRKSIVPENTVTVYNWKNTTRVHGLLNSIRCEAIGKPLPNVGIYKELKDGSLEELHTESLVFHGIQLTQATHVLNATDINVAGDYVCRAESGTAIAETRTHVVVMFFR